MQIPQPGDFLGPYRIQRMIGQGGMGVVYAATDTRLGREVALKVITGPLASTEEYRRRFHHEALAMSRVQSPWIVQIHDHDEVDGFPYIVTQFIEGTDLGSLVAEERQLSPKRALRLCAQIARGLDDAHRAGVLHRDVKPGNVLLAEPGTTHEHAYLCDFGIAISDAASHHTATGMVAGTWAYLAPERTLGAPAVPASDLYAVGCVLWTCLTGREPYVGTQVEIAIAHASAPVPQLGADDPFARSLNRMFARVLAKEPTHRHADGAALAVELEQFAATAPDHVLEVAAAPAAPETAVSPSTPHTTPTPPPPPPLPSAPPTPGSTVSAAASPSPKRRRWPLVVGGLAMLALVAGATAWAGLAAREDDEPTAEPDAEVPELVTGDVDGDGLGDVLAQQRADSLSPTNSTGGLWPLLSTGSSPLGPANPAGTETGAPFLGDVDGDGLPDQVWFANAPGSTYRVRVITGTRDIWEQTQQLSALVEWGDDLVPLLADVDGDGRDDLVFSNQVISDDPDDGYLVSVHAAIAGDREFAEPETVAELGPIDKPITGVGDFDGDGDDDLFRAINMFDKEFTRIIGLEVQAFLNEDGQFEPQEVTKLDHQDWGAGWFVAGDPDGDGQDELVVTNGRGGAAGVVEYADGAFGQVEERLAPTIPEKEWEDAVADSGAPHFKHALSDVDGDGDDDLVALAYRKDVAVGVALSDGTRFASYEKWGVIECDDLTGLPCDQFSLVVNVAPSIS